MLIRLLVIFIFLCLLASCVSPPVEQLADARTMVSRAHAVNAADYAPGEYQLATSALQAAEEQMEEGAYRDAERTLALAKRYADSAFVLAQAEKERIAEEKAYQQEQQRQAELEKQRKLEQQRLAKQAKQRELEKRRLAEKRRAEEEAAQDTADTVPVDSVPLMKVKQVEVLAGENLAMVAARPEVYADAQLWPLIYRANRDQIKDPQEVFAGQILLVPRDKSRDEVEAARREAEELDLF